MKRIATLFLLVAVPFLVLSGCEKGGIDQWEEGTDTQAASDQATEGTETTETGDEGDEATTTGSKASVYAPCKLITLDEAMAAVNSKLEVEQDDRVADPPKPMICRYGEPIGNVPTGNLASVQLSINGPATLATGMTAETLYDTTKSFVTNVQDVANLGDAAYYTKDVEAQGVNVLLKSKNVYFKVNVFTSTTGTKADNSFDVAKELAQAVIDKL